MQTLQQNEAMKEQQQQERENGSAPTYSGSGANAPAVDVPHSPGRNSLLSHIGG